MTVSDEKCWSLCYCLSGKSRPTESFHLQGNEFSKIIEYDYTEKFPENSRRVTKVRTTLFFSFWAHCYLSDTNNWCHGLYLFKQSILFFKNKNAHTKIRSNVILSQSTAGKHTHTWIHTPRRFYRMLIKGWFISSSNRKLSKCP